MERLMPLPVSVRAALTKCLNTNQRSTYIYLPGYITNLDKIEIVPGIEAEVLVHGCSGGYGRKQRPTIAVLKCSDVRRLLNQKERNRCRILPTKSPIRIPRHSLDIAKAAES